MTADPYLPQEIIDHIIDFLYDKPETLNACCLVSKSWIPRARKYLFAEVEFSSIRDFESWMETFPDTFNSPGHQTRTLIVRCARVVAARDGGTDDLIKIFPSVVRLTLTTFYNSALLVTDVLNTVNLTPFYELSSTLKSLHVDFIYLPRSQTFNFLSSLPLLEDLGLVGRDFWPEAHEPQGAALSISPAFTGFLELNIFTGTGITARWLLDLSGGLRFRKLCISWSHEEDILWTKELVTRCSDTLECLDVRSQFHENGLPGSVDLSKAPKLVDVVFRPGSLATTWITTALQTITSENQDLREVSIHTPNDLTFILGTDASVYGDIYEQWLALDRCLVELWESRSIRPNVIGTVLVGMGYSLRDALGTMMPEMTKRGWLD